MYLLALLLAMLFVVPAFVFAGGGQESEEEVAADEPVELVVWTATAPNPFTDAMDVRFRELYPNIEIATVLREGDPGNEYFSAVARGDAPDVLLVSITKYDQYQKAGILQNVSDLGLPADISNLDAAFVDSLRRDGDLYGIPNRSFPMLFGYNRALFAEAGLDGPPANWDQFIEYARRLNDPANGVSGYGMLSGQWTDWWFQYYVWQAGGDLTLQNPDDTITLTFDDPAVTAAAQLYQQLVRENLIQSDITAPFPQMVSLFAAGRVAMMPLASDWVNWVIGEGMSQDDLGLALFPAGPSGSRQAAISGDVWIINPTIPDERKQAALDYISWMVSREYQQAFFSDMAARDALNPEPMVRTDLSLSDIGDIPEAYAEVLSASLIANRAGEFYGKGEFAGYVDAAVQQVIANPDADAAEIFRRAQEQAISEGAVEAFNNNL